MEILRTREVWRKPRARPVRSGTITPEEAANVRAALDVLKKRYGSYPAIGKALGWTTQAISYRMAPKGARPTVELAFAVARHVKVPVEDILAGAWPKPEACPWCGRGDGR